MHRADPVGGNSATTPKPDPSYRQVVADARRAGLTLAEIGEVVGSDEHAVRSWTDGSGQPEGASRDRLFALQHAIEALSDVYTDEGIEKFLHTRQPALDDQRPIDLLRDGHVTKVLALADRLAGGPKLADDPRP